MSLKYTTVPSKILAESITSAATSFKLNNIKGWDGDNLVAGDFGSTAYGVFRNANKTAIEIFEWDPSTIGNSSITITRRGLQFDGNLTTEVAANKLSWTKGDTYVDLGTDTPQLFQDFLDYLNAAIISGGVPATTLLLGIAKMSTAPADPNSPIAVGTNDPRLPTQSENDAMAGGASFGTPSSTNKFLTEEFPRNKKIAISTSTTEIANATTTETNVFSQSIAGGTLSTNNVVKFRLNISDFSSDADANSDLTIRFKYGSTTLATIVLDNGTTANATLKGYIEGYIYGNGSTSSQFASLMVDLVADDLTFNAAIASKGARAFSTGTASEDSTTAKNLILSIQWGAGNGANNFVPAGLLIESIT